MPTEDLLPDGNVAGSHDWLNEVGGTGTFLSIDEGIAGDGDTTFIERLDNTPASDDNVTFTLGNPVGTPDTDSGPGTWTLKTLAKKVGALTPDTFAVTLLEGVTVRAGPFSHAAALTESYQTFDDAFDPAEINDVNNLRVRFAGNSDLSGLADPRVSAFAVRIQQLVGGGDQWMDMGLGWMKPEGWLEWWNRRRIPAFCGKSLLTKAPRRLWHGA